MMLPSGDTGRDLQLEGCFAKGQRCSATGWPLGRATVPCSNQRTGFGQGDHARAGTTLPTASIGLRAESLGSKIPVGPQAKQRIAKADGL